MLLISRGGLLIAGSARAQQFTSTRGSTVRTVELVRTPLPRNVSCWRLPIRPASVPAKPMRASYGSRPHGR